MPSEYQIRFKVNIADKIQTNNMQSRIW